jgi:hypothetical protein
VALTGAEVQPLFNSGHDVPVLCAPGTYNTDTGAEPCTPAPAGTFVDTTGATVATDCAPGSYSSVAGATSCVLAAPGTFVATAGAIAAADCPLGTFSPVAGADQCQLAPIGTYVDTTGASVATDCPAGTSTLFTGSASEDDCIPVVLDTDGDGVDDPDDLCPYGCAHPFPGANASANGGTGDRRSSNHRAAK